LGFKSPNAAEDICVPCKRKGRHRFDPGCFTRHSAQNIYEGTIGLPLIGRVAAGRPILAEEHIERRYQIDPQLFQPAPHYL